MKIAQIVGSVDLHRGGKERFVAELIKELMKVGHEVTLITCDQRFKSGINCDVNYIRGWSPPGFPVIPSPKDLNKALQTKFDIVHLHYHALFGETVALASKINDQTLITTIHDEMKRDPSKILYDMTLLRTISCFSDKIICLTEGMKRAIVRRGLDGQKVVVIPNAMYVKELQSQASNLSDNINFDSGFDILFVGRIEERKGVQYLLKALMLLKKEGFCPTLKIVGGGVYKHKLMSLVKENELSSQVVFTGYISQEELLKSYLHTRCVVVPSLYEGTPNRVVIEALALGKPVITTSIPGMEAISSEGLGFVAPPRDSKALADAIRNVLILSDDKLRNLGLETKKFVEQYDWSCVINKIISLYNDFY